MDNIYRNVAEWVSSLSGIDHIALILDGNRRYAKMNNLDTISGHTLGTKNFFKVLKYCYYFKVRTVTVFAMSVDNFYLRPKKEVDDLIGLLDQHLLQTGEALNINFVGSLHVLPSRLQERLRACNAAAKKMRSVQEMRVNICFVYSSDDEITQASLQLKHQVGTRYAIWDEMLHAIDRLKSGMMGRDLFSPDVLIRTSGVERLSDFLLFQACETTKIFFIKKTWPEFGFFDILWIFLKLISCN